MDKKDIYRKITEYFKDKPVKKIQVFGSFARNEQKKESDIDILLEMEHPVGVDVTEVWSTIEDDLPVLKKQIESLLENN